MISYQTLSGGDRLRVGVIGAGAMGQNHIRTYSQMPGIELLGISDVNGARLEQISKQYGTEGFRNYKDLLKQGPDAVSIALPTTLHRQAALDSISANASILVEKPIADTIQNACSIVSAAEKEHLTLMVGHIERFNPAVQKAKQIIDDGELGNIVSISTRRVGPYNPRTRDVGVILDIGVHDIDIVSYLYDLPVDEVFAIAGREFHPYEDHASILLRFKPNKAGVVETNWLTPHKTRDFTVIGTEGVAYGDYMKQTVSIHDKEWIREAKIDKKEPLRCELEGFVSACSGHCKPLVTGQDGIHALEVALAAIESYRRGVSIRLSHAAAGSATADEPGVITI